MSQALIEYVERRVAEDAMSLNHIEVLLGKEAELEVSDEDDAWLLLLKAELFNGPESGEQDLG
jgi:hypothetical protein